MPRTKGSKNKPKTVTADFVTQIAEKQSAKEALTAEIASITANIDTLKADLKVKKAALKKAECFLQDLFGKKCRTFWRILHLQIGENCRGTGRSFFTDRVPVQA